MQTDLVPFESIILKSIGKVSEMAKTILKESTREEESSLYNSKHGGSHNQDSHTQHVIVNKTIKHVIL